MSQSPQQFTPAQILEAGQRAEAEGQVEYAIQFYRHLTDHLPRTQEAAAARDAVVRITGRFPPDTSSFPGNVASAGTPNTAAARLGSPPPGTNGASAPQAQPNGWARSGTATPIGYGGAPPPQAASRPAAVRQGGITVAPVGGDMPPRPTYTHNRSRRRYRTGRMAAAIINVLGFLQILTGLALMVLAVPGLAPSAISSFVTLGLPAGGALLISGLFQIFVAQLARAMFDTASANRDLAAMTRWRLTHEGGQATPRDDG